MNTTRRKELLEAYKNRHPEMGVVSVRCRETGDLFYAAASDTVSKRNSIRFQLSSGNCPNKQLQRLWEQYGEGAFEMDVVKCLEYEDLSEDHTEELEILYELCLIENPQAQRLWK